MKKPRPTKTRSKPKVTVMMATGENGIAEIVAVCRTPKAATRATRSFIADAVLGLRTRFDTEDEADKIEKLAETDLNAALDAWRECQDGDLTEHEMEVES